MGGPATSARLPSYHWRWYPLAYFVVFQVAWLLAVGNGGGQWPWVGPFVTLPIALIHLGMMRAPWREAGLLALAAAVGFCADSLLGFYGFLLYHDGVGGTARGLAPPWMIAMWVLFAGTLRTTCAWLQGRYLLATVFGAIGGPLAYAAGVRLGALELPQGWTIGMLAVGGEWMLAMPYLAYAAKQIDDGLAKRDTAAPPLAKDAHAP